MSRSITITALVFFVVILTEGCTKQQNGTSSPYYDMLFVPFGADSIIEPVSVPPYAGSVLPAATGVLIACKTSAAVADTTSQPILYNRVWEAAYFKGDNAIGASAGTVSVNAVSLHEGLGSYYQHYDNTPAWNENSSNHWTVAGYRNIPSVEADATGAFPMFTDTLPTVIARAKDFSLNINSSNTINADSAYIVVWCHFPGKPTTVSNVVDAKGGIATIGANALSYMQNTYAPFNLALVAGQQYYGGLIMLILYNHVVQTIDGKQFVFVKQREYIQQVTFL